MTGDPTRERLDAYVDGELSAGDASQIAALLAARPDLEAYVKRQIALRNELHAAMAPLLDEPIPESLSAAIANTPTSARSLPFARLRNLLRDGIGWRVGIPAAALACGLLIGIGIAPAPDNAPFAISPLSGRLVAQGTLSNVLTRQLASAASVSAERIGISFRNKSGEDCRTFEMNRNGSSVAGLACREGGEWVIGALASNQSEVLPDSPYQPAASAMPDIIRGAVAATIAGEPFDAEAEKKARDAGWQSR